VTTKDKKFNVNTENTNLLVVMKKEKNASRIQPNVQYLDRLARAASVEVKCRSLLDTDLVRTLLSENLPRKLFVDIIWPNNHFDLPARKEIQRYRETTHHYYLCGINNVCLKTSVLTSILYKSINLLFYRYKIYALILTYLSKALKYCLAIKM